MAEEKNRRKYQGGMSVDETEKGEGERVEVQDGEFYKEIGRKGGETSKAAREQQKEDEE